MKHQGLNNSRLALAHRALQGLPATRTQAERPAEGSCRARGDCSPQKDLMQEGAELPRRITKSP